LRCGVLQCVAVCCSVLQCVAVRHSLLPCVAVYCSVFTLQEKFFCFFESGQGASVTKLTAIHQICNILQHTATCMLPEKSFCTVDVQRAVFHSLQHTATHCNTLQHIATHCNTLQHTATHCNTLQHTVQHTVQHTATTATCTVPAKSFLTVDSKRAAIVTNVSPARTEGEGKKTRKTYYSHAYVLQLNFEKAGRQSRL